MSDSKKYYYMRVKENFYETEDMVILQSMDNGYLYSDILMKLYLKSLKNEGRLMFKDHIPYNAKMIATITGHNIDVVEKSLKIFKELNLIDILDNGAIYMLDIQNFIGQTSTEADRIKIYRQKIKEETKQITGGVQMYDERTPEIELELEIEIEKDIELKKDIDIKKKKKNTTEYFDLTFIDDSIDKVKITKEQYDKLLAKYGEYQLHKEILALDNYIVNGKGNKYKDHYRALNTWCSKNQKEVKQSNGSFKQNIKPTTPKEIRGEGEELAKRAIEKYGNVGDTQCDF